MSKTTLNIRVMYTIATGIFPNRLLKEGFLQHLLWNNLIDFFTFIRSSSELKTYGDPIIHTTRGVGEDANQGHDAFVPLIIPGIYLAVWSNQKFYLLSLIPARVLMKQKDCN